MRTERLFTFLELQDDYLTQYDVAWRSGLYPPTERPSDYHDSASRLQMSRDIKEINNSLELGIIVSNKQGIKVATEDEFTDFINAKMAKVLRDFKYVNRMIKKGSLHNQIAWSDCGKEIVKIFKEADNEQSNSNG